MGNPRTRLGREERASRGSARGFTLIDLLASIAVVALLIGILLPSLGRVHESAKRVVCASNLRQVGLGVHMYTTDNDSRLPPSTFAMGYGPMWGTDPMVLRIDGRSRGYDMMLWDGMGYLFFQSYLSDGQIFYCPSHNGEHPFTAYAPQFAGQDGEIIANYQYRGIGPNGEERLENFQQNIALVADGFREMLDINHSTGMNVLRAGMSVDWFVDRDNWMANAMLSSDSTPGQNWNDGWQILDRPAVQNSGFWDRLW